MQADVSPSTRRLVFECSAGDGFRTSPMVFTAGSTAVPGVHAASHQLAEHVIATHNGDPSIGFASVDLTESE